jgi:hypothetical protein
LTATTTVRSVRAVFVEGRDSSYPLTSEVGRPRFVGRVDSYPLMRDEGRGAGKVEAVTRAVVKNVAVATSDRGDSRDTPQRK